TELKDLREFIARIKGLRAELAAFKHVSEVGESKRVDALNAVNALAEEFGRKEDFRKKLAKEKLEHAAELIRQGKISRVWLVLDGAVNRAGSRITAINNTLKPKSLTRQALLENYKKEVEGQKNALAKTLLKHLHDSIGKAIDFQASVSKTADFTKKLVGFYGKKLSDIMNKTAVPNTQQNYYLKNIVAPKLFKQAKELKARTKAKKMLEAAELLENASKHLKNGAWNDARTALRAAYAKSNEVEKYGLLTEEHHRQLLENHDHLVYALSRRVNEPKIGQVVELVKNSRTALEQKRFGPSHHYLLKAVENGV
ncbi:hypothetical protein H0N96_03315, partial [Candidatus Micrarchaeota archaeon]|nr:hypothetical protein [Candidatus Micrarchaeota archaeon]